MTDLPIEGADPTRRSERCVARLASNVDDQRTNSVIRQRVMYLRCWDNSFFLGQRWLGETIRV